MCFYMGRKDKGYKGNGGFGGFALTSPPSPSPARRGGGMDLTPVSLSHKERGWELM